MDSYAYWYTVQDGCQMGHSLAAVWFLSSRPIVRSPPLLDGIIFPVLRLFHGSGTLLFHPIRILVKTKLHIELFHDALNAHHVGLHLE